MPARLRSIACAARITLARALRRRGAADPLFAAR
jgi:hypothetical protein